MIPAVSQLEELFEGLRVGDRGTYSWRTGRRTPGDAASDALRACGNGAHCRIYAVENRLAN